MKIPFVYANLQLIFKNPPDEYKGIVRENWTICNDGDHPLSVILWGLVKNTTLFYYVTHKSLSIDDVNKELDKLQEIITNRRLKEIVKEE